MKKVLIHILLTAILFATFEPVGKLISADVPPVLITAIRFLLGGFVLLLPALNIIRRERLRLTARILLKTAALGVLLVCGAMVCLQQAVLLSASPAVVAIVFSVNSVFSISLAWLVLKEKISKWHVVGFLLCICGIIISADLTHKISVLPVILAGLAAALFSVYSVLGKKATENIPGTVFTCLSFLFGGGILMLAQIVMGIQVGQFIQVKTLPPLIYLGFIVTGIGFWDYFNILKLSTAFHASLVFFIKIILIPFTVWIINGLPPEANILVAMALVLAGSVIATVLPVATHPHKDKRLPKARI
ncbi:MAG: DMT family transporter [Eubacteriales bacterium]|nr:DMT family transporter [Eubacteriales bacterium]